MAKAQTLVHQSTVSFANLLPVVINDPTLPLVSIVTPSYNQGAFIRATITSVLRQDYPNIEYWVIDGGSSDETLSILQEYAADPRLQWISERDHGQSDAINKGLARCRGSIFAWLNSDDVLLPGALRQVAAAFQAAPHPVVVFGLAKYIDQDGHDLGYCDNQLPSMNLERLLQYQAHPKQPATFAPTECVRAVGGVDCALHYSMDLDLWIKLAAHLEFRHVPQVLALYRLHATSKTVATTARFVDDAIVILGRAVGRGWLTEQQAQARLALFTARLHLMPESRNLLLALGRLKAAVDADPATLPIALLILFKGVLRSFVHPQLWASLRVAQAKWGRI